MWTVFKVFNLVQYCFCFCLVFLATSHGGLLAPPPGTKSNTPVIEGKILTTGPPGKWKWSCSVVSNSLPPHGLYPTRLLCPLDFLGKGTGVGCHFLLQGLFPTQGWNPVRLHCRQTLYCLSLQGSPKKHRGKEWLVFQGASKTHFTISHLSVL